MNNRANRPRVPALLALLVLPLLLAAALLSCDRETKPAGVRVWQDALASAIAKLDDDVGERADTGAGRTWYQVFVYSFCDSDGDGVGDLNGVAERLDYIGGMGFDGIWLSPIHPSDTYHKYNVRDYYDVDPEYGTLEDFDALIKACHERGLRVLMDLVINHTDLKHPWFTEHPEYYNITDETMGGGWARLPDGRYYECQFWDQMPDLNLESASVREELEKVCAFWLGRGADGFRLDAAKEYVTGNFTKNVEILSWLTAAVKALDPGAYLVAEAWETSTAVYDYYKSGIDSMFAFPFSGSEGAIARLLLRADEKLAGYFEKVEAAQGAISAYNPNATDAPFFTNHDMARAAGFMRRDPNLIKTAWGLSLMQPGDAFVYYGEELGMTGSGKDENKRAPMYWTDDAQAPGMALGPPGMEPQTNGFPPATEQVGDPGSIFNYVRSAVLLRGKYPQISRGSFEALPTGDGAKAGAVRRSWQGSDILVAYNVSAEPVDLDLPGADVLDVLSATGELPERNGDVLYLPGYCIAILGGILP